MHLIALFTFALGGCAGLEGMIPVNTKNETTISAGGNFNCELIPLPDNGPPYLIYQNRTPTKEDPSTIVFWCNNGPERRFSCPKERTHVKFSAFADRFTISPNPETARGHELLYRLYPHDYFYETDVQVYCKPD